MHKPWTIAVDLDGVLAAPTSPDNYANASPMWENIKKVNDLYDKGHKIVIHTARGWFNYDMTRNWLLRFQVKFDQLVMGKFYAHAYVNDLNYTLDELTIKLGL